MNLFPDKPDSRLRILCVDDNIHLLRTYKLVLERSGFEVVTAFHGIDALMQYQAHQGRWGAIVTSNSMPQMCGLQFVRTIREAGFKGKIVVASGCLHPEVQKAYELYAVSGFVHKPFGLNQLASMLLKEN